MTQLRKLERQARQLLYKMDRIQSDWNGVKKELKAKGKDIPHELGDVLGRWNKK